MIAVSEYQSIGMSQPSTETLRYPDTQTHSKNEHE